MKPGKLYRVTRELVIHREDFTPIKVDHGLEALEILPADIVPLQTKRKLKAIWGVQIAEDLATDLLLGGSSSIIPAGSVVFYVEQSERTRNHLLIFQDFVGWTDMITEAPGLFQETNDDEEG